METAKKGDFVEIEFTGFSDGKPFDSNVEEDLKKISSEAKAEKTIIIIGEGMIIPGFDKALENKEIGKQYEVHIAYKEGFGERKRDFLKTLPLKVFTEKNVNPKPGMALYLDNTFVRIIAVSGARVITDFNNPLAGKDLIYKFRIIGIVSDEKEKAEAFFKFFFRFVPEFEITSEKIIVKGQKNLEPIIKLFNDKFKQLFSKELDLKAEEKTEEDPKSIKTQQ